MHSYLPLHTQCLAPQERAIGSLIRYTDQQTMCTTRCINWCTSPTCTALTYVTAASTCTSSTNRSAGCTPRTMQRLTCDTINPAVVDEAQASGKLYHGLHLSPAVAFGRRHHTKPADSVPATQYQQSRCLLGSRRAGQPHHKAYLLAHRPAEPAGREK